MIATRTRRAVAIGLGLGALAGAGIAAFEPAATGSPTVQPYTAPTAPLQRAAARAPLGHMASVMRRLPGGTSVSRPIPDPAGGPAWVVRMTGYRYPEQRRDGVTVRSTLWCGQLLRRVDGRLGWIDGTSTFRPVATNDQEGDTPRMCIGGAIRSSTTAQTLTLLERADEPEPRALGAAIWGFSGIRTSRHVLRVDGRRVPVRADGPHATFVAFHPTGTRLQTSLSVRLPDGRRQRALTDGVWTGRPNGSSDDRVRVATERIAVRAADPGGGASWGLVVAQRDDGQWCSAVAGQLVGRFAGTIDQRLGTFSRQSVLNEQGSCIGGRDTRPSRKRPVITFPTGYLVAGTSDGLPTERALRRQRGRAALAGRTLSTVRTLTIATRTSVRTVVPSGPDHAFLLVYDTGSLGLMNFMAGRAEVTARFADGHQETMTVAASGL